ncbi:UvrD-helicase domain-containing protein [Sediminibacillus massiliensis]|uniref:UvrD-helicase domain-containing protein n=1 Tax=Sediminibacillus massiliensis TaxID=1926277 RepID=UPI0009886139|nr:UvrD-helicase domain-containing protein [Sediminibacillus massiliensis]
MSNQPTFYSYPLGSKNKKISEAAFAGDKTSVELVSDHDSDAPFFRSLEQNGIHLNQPQIEAVRHYEGPALVLAGAGSGKTRVLTSRTGYLISMKKVDPKKMMLVTFTKKAADEMKQRLQTLPGIDRRQVDSITIGTFHSIFFRLLRSKGFNQRVLSSENRKQLAIKLILKKKSLQDTYEPETLLAILSSYKNNMQNVHDMPEKTKVEKEIKDILRQYEQWKQENNFIDFDDMLLETFYLLINQPKLLQAMQNRFAYILCDEWQDTNPIQFELIKMIAKPDNNLFVVGDDDQTIYTFNGADSSIILNFEKLYPDASVITLDINYRSTSSILGIANQVIQYNEHRHHKQLRATKASPENPYYLRPPTTDEEAIAILDKIETEVQNGTRNYSDFAILHRTNSSARAIFDQLVMKGIPFLSYTKGESFYEQGLVKPVIDYLRIAIEPGNLEAIQSILPTLYLNREKAMYHIEAEQLINPSERPLKHLIKMRGLKDFQKKQIEERINMIKDIKDRKPVKAVKKIRQFYDKFLEADERHTLTLHKEMLLESLSEIEASAAKFQSVSDFVAFIDEVVEKNKEMETIRRTPNANAVSLMTIHRAKGLEFPVVFLTGASEGILPHSSALEASDRKDIISENKGREKIQAAIEEERRLAYVAITRAQSELYICSPSYYRGEQAEVSRFILDPFLPEQERSNNSSNKREKKTTMLVWDCTSDQCKCWMRIDSRTETGLDSKECPMCKGEMKQTAKEV